MERAHASLEASSASMKLLHDQGKIFYTKNGIPRFKRFLEEQEGPPLQVYGIIILYGMIRKLSFLCLGMMSLWIMIHKSQKVYLSALLKRLRTRIR